MKNTLKYHEKDRHATWLELFFDLVFVAIIGIIGHTIAQTHEGHFSFSQVTLFILEFIPIWWIWTSHTVYSNRFDTDNKVHRLTTLLIMFLVVMIPTFAGYNIQNHFELLIIAYVIIRWIISALYISSKNKFGRQSEELATTYAKWYFFGALISLSSLLFEGNTKYVVFYSGIVFDFLMPFLYSKKLKKVPIHIPHLVERTGLLVIILMGESIISLVKALQDVTWNSSNLTSAITGFILLGAIWWIYFDSFHNLERSNKSLTGVSITYSHLILCLGILSLSGVVRYGIIQDIDKTTFSLLAGMGMMFFYLGKQIPYYLLFPNMRRELILNSVVVVSITIISTFLPAIEYTLIGMTLGLFYYVYANMMLLKTKDVSAYINEES